MHCDGQWCSSAVKCERAGLSQVLPALALQACYPLRTSHSRRPPPPNPVSGAAAALAAASEPPSHKGLLEVDQEVRGAARRSSGAAAASGAEAKGKAGPSAWVWLYGCLWLCDLTYRTAVAAWLETAQALPPHPTGDITHTLIKPVIPLFRAPHHLQEADLLKQWLAVQQELAAEEERQRRDALSAAGEGEEDVGPALPDSQRGGPGGAGGNFGGFLRPGEGERYAGPGNGGGTRSLRELLIHHVVGGTS